VTAASARLSPPARRSLFGHPPGLTILFLTQMWAEFSYFGLQALLVYYMTGQLHFSQTQSSLIYGTYGAAAFFSPFFGGMIADKWLGRTRSVVAGGVMMMLGHFAMAFPALLFPALALVALGNGLFIPPLAVQVGALYADDDPRKAHAFSAYYMGINLGGFLAPLICGSLGELVGWHWGFAAAGVGMFAGLVIYLGFRRLLPADPREVEQAKDTLPVAIDGRAVRLLVAIVAVVILFRIAYEQSGNVIALWVRDDTDRNLFGLFTIPATWFQALNPLGIILLTPLLIRRWGRHKEKASTAVLLSRMSLGCVIAGTSMLVMVLAAMVHEASGQPVSAWWTILYFVLLTIGELLVIPVGLTLVDLLSPAGFAATAMGAWYIAKFLGTLLAGVMGSWWEKIPASSFFGLGAASVLLAAGILSLISGLEKKRG
jgi:proton-dependent oligopeptide transporter, POT family